MSISVEINRISDNVNNALSAIADKGVSVPSGSNSDDLATLISQVECGIDTSDATANAGDILSGKTAYVNGKKITGTIASQAAQTITPSTSAKTIAAGKYLSGTQTILGDANLIPANIASGVSIFGVAGTLASASTPFSKVAWLTYTPSSRSAAISANHSLGVVPTGYYLYAMEEPDTIYSSYPQMFEIIYNSSLSSVVTSIAGSVNANARAIRSNEVVYSGLSATHKLTASTISLSIDTDGVRFYNIAYNIIVWAD